MSTLQSEVGNTRRPDSAEVSLAERLAFERLLADLSASFTNLPGDHVIDEIERALAHLVEFLDFDRSTFTEFSVDGTQINVLCSVARNGVEPVPRGPAPQLTWYIRELRAGRIVVLASLPDDLPRKPLPKRSTTGAPACARISSSPCASPRA